ncbi:MAG: cytochrome P450 [Bauldia sp.]|nr:cytochrome P450 [Bauldia sp.]
MNVVATPVLAKVTPPEGVLSPLRLLRTLTSNPMATWPRAIYEEKVVRARFLRTDVLFVIDPDLIKQVLLDEVDSFVRSEATRRALGPAVGEALLTSDGEKWRWQRRAVAPILRPDRVAGFFPAISAAAGRTRDRWLARSGDILDVAREMTRTTFDIIAATMLSGAVGHGAGKIEEAIARYLDSTAWKVALALLATPVWMPYPGRARADRARDLIHEELARVVAERRRSGERRNDLVTLLIEAKDPESGQTMSDRDIANNLFTFIAAGHETTALALTWTFYLLSRHPEIEESLVEEIASVTGGGALAAEHVECLQLTRQVVHEAMRLYPPAPIVARQALRATSIGGEAVTEGMEVMIPIYALHRHRRLWADPDRFDPGRFQPEAAKLRHRYAYLPFGAGPRICVGMGFAMLEAVAILATLLPAFRPRLAEGQTPELTMRVTLRPAHGMKMTMSPR